MVVSQEKFIARYGTEDERCRLAARRELPPELLFFLGTDPSERVRLEVVRNPSAPPHILRILARDDQLAVREAIAQRMRDLLQGVAPSVTDRLARIIESTLTYLAKDAVASVRAALAQAIADLPQVSRETVLALARDTEFEVADPIIRLSPILEDDDLLDLIAFPAAEFTRASVAGRPKISERVTDSIAATGDVNAVRALLYNDTAHISDATLENIAEQSRDSPTWQEALAHRRHVPEKVLRILATFIADDYALLLAERGDLSPEIKNQLRARLTHLANKQIRDSARSAWTPSPAPVDIEARFLLLLEDQKNEEAVQLLAQRLGTVPATIWTIVERKQPAEIVTLAWSAGFSMRSAVLMQERLAKLPRGKILLRSAGQDWPLDEDSLRVIHRRLFT